MSFSFLKRFESSLTGRSWGAIVYTRHVEGQSEKVGIAGALLGSQVIITDEPPRQPRCSKSLRYAKAHSGTGTGQDHSDLSRTWHVAGVCIIVVLEKGRSSRDIEANQDTLRELEAISPPDPFPLCVGLPAAYNPCLSSRMTSWYCIPVAYVPGGFALEIELSGSPARI